MRNAILEILGLLIRELSLTEAGALDLDDAKHARLLESFFQALFDRFLDLNSYVRAKTAAVLLRTCDLPPMFPKLRLELTKLAVRSLHDKAATVRKNCLALLNKLVLTHPYGRMHGGELALSEWQDRLGKLEEELKVLDLPDAAEVEARRLMEGGDDEEQDEAKEGEEKSEGAEDDSDHGSDSDLDGEPKPPKSPSKAKKAPRKSHLDVSAADQSAVLQTVSSDTLSRLEIEGALETVTELLASSVKSEVLEAMEVTKTAKEYKVEAAEVCSSSLFCASPFFPSSCAH
jgi:condensin complex subunit 1